MTENVESGNAKYEILNNEVRMKKIKIFGAWITTCCAAFFIGNVLAKSFYGTVHYISGDLDHPDLLISPECYLQLPIYILEYKYVSSSEVDFIIAKFRKSTSQK